MHYWGFFLVKMPVWMYKVNIAIENPVFIVLNQGKIRANADKGRGGNIPIGFTYGYLLFTFNPFGVRNF